ncbi:MAG: PilC/PilY family type IV pilus protein [Motiliproteus sp.]|nr:PilC/PilY family type IV pilus protein [Motiliproteus sp.]MCW9052313.1 PilC/PilY family type IV pilus protein [Motiliproteus sp.]
MNKTFKALLRSLMTFGCAVALATSSAWGAIADTPLFLTQSVDPRIMLVMSNDHQLSIKAYTDYSDLDSDGTLDTTYSDSIDYNGYFDSDKCYTYDNGDNRFEPATTVDTGTHQCTTSTAHWSGNFLNWATMTRMDLVRYVFYGGLRSTDTATETVLERAYLPDDVHAFAKVFTTANTTDMRKYTPYAQTEITLCNFTDGGTSLSKDVTTAPSIRVALGTWARWAASEVTQCQWGSGTQPNITLHRLENPDLVARVQVCKSGLLESNCRSYSSGTYKPSGLLQEYGEDSNNRPIRFGLMTGSYAKNKSGGVLRRNVERITGNATSSKNEIDTSTGIFLNQGTTDEGIINTLNRLRIASYDHDSDDYLSGCDTPGILSFNDGECVDWGNPLSEMYLEALRYLAGKSSATTAFNANDSSHISSLPQVSWLDPMPATDYCADTSILTISTGLNSFDTDQLSGNDLSIDADAQTDAVGTLEGISGSYLIGEGSVTDDNECTAKTLTNLSHAKGICPEAPSIEGGYQVAGLAYYARTNDLRSDRTNDQTLTTYGVALAESLPSFEVTVGSGKVTLLPACSAHSIGSSALGASGWRSCSMTDLIVEYHSSTEGSFLVNWEDSTWGNDYDMDGISRIQYCVGSSCPNTSFTGSVSSSQIRVRIEAAQANAGHALKFGYTITGTTTDGIYMEVLRPGGSDYNIGDTVPAAVSSPDTNTHTQGSSSASLLKNPLWYTAKYGGFNEADATTGPNLTSEWDDDGDGTPDTFFMARNPAELGASLGSVFNDVVSRVSTASAITTNSTRLDTTTLAFRALFNSGEWSGQLLALPINSDGSLGSAVWNAAEEIPAASSRKIFSWDPSSSAGFDFNTTNLSTITAIESTLNTNDEVNYLRGDTSNEQQNGGTLRNRPVTSGVANVLGDIVNSDPAYVSTENFGYEGLGGSEGTAYASFRATSAYAGRKPMLYISANDGMLHGFYVGEDTNADGVLDADSDGTQPGEEVFAFIPSSVYGNLESLTKPTYSHSYFVDGSPHVGDAYINPYGSGDTWLSVLVSTVGAGGKGVFAIDVTNPDPSAMTASKVLWEITSSTTGFSDLGYTIGDATFVRLANGEWGAIFSNGYDSSSGKAVLYIVNLEDGSLIKSFDTETTGNGMSTPVVVDSDGDFIADLIYVGDLEGNLWKIDISHSNSGNWDFSFYSGNGASAVPAPLFVAIDQASSSVVQPITAKPQVGDHSDGGLMIYFGTGQYYQTGDNTVPAVPQIQTFYAVRDYSDEQVNSDRSQLVAQTIEAEGTLFNFNIRVTSDNEDSSKTKGWYLNLQSPSTNGQGERVVNQPILRGDRVIFTTLIPDNDVCSDGGSSWLMELEAETGKRLTEVPFDLNEDGVFNDTDKATLIDTDGDGIGDLTTNVSGIQKAGMGIIDNPAILEAGSKDIKIISGSSGNTQAIGESNSDAGGRQGWQQLR